MRTLGTGTDVYRFPRRHRRHRGPLVTKKCRCPRLACR
ncbi:hypothetical protein I552_0257 [Mycobacterium xenopi 3993]|nr:hypothetical protein I552_0257 [Mycobacterium xenopi 3993]